MPLVDNHPPRSIGTPLCVPGCPMTKSLQGKEGGRKRVIRRFQDMTTTLRILNPSFHPISRPTPVRGTEISALRTYLRNFDPFDRNYLLSTMADNLDDFTAAISKYALATLAGMFDLRENVIAVLDEAIFCEMRIRIWLSPTHSSYMIAVSQEIDHCEPHMIDKTSFEKAISTISPLGGGDVSIRELADELADETIYERLCISNCQHALPSLRNASHASSRHPNAILSW